MSGTTRFDFREEICEANLSNFVLAQRMLREDKAMAMFTMGISEEVANILLDLSVAQTLELARTGQWLFRFRFDDHKILSALTNKAHTNKRGTGATHAALLLAGQAAEVIG